ncbi:YraN family protein [candidate division WOR-3 bacterium JGI_Cruoil_03_51_56]|uniref:UPF0102 protein CH330_03740 n=1 Tax=candidate division WOR-3 bacterium JGI_Cruoil_03_51_56 TaxID=1973747 RepID=A0A235BV31_UNCW3|nr:MAG: YraN family protein [candidate division WOR-3 bacterium JGI_Cruoil_03_51_56]
MNRKAVGQKGEQLACDFLKEKGYRILDRNHRSRLGEIDIVCNDSGAIVFVEVKTRTSNRFGLPAESVGPQKQKRLRRLAQEYLITHQLEQCDVRFDVLSIMLSSEPPAIEHIYGAF